MTPEQQALAAAMREAVKRKVFPSHGFEDQVLAAWVDLQAIIDTYNTALIEAKP